MTIEFFITTLIVVLIPGTGVIYTLTIGLTQGWRASLVAALGCTLGIIPSLAASLFGLAAIMHTSALLFEIVKYFGVAYLLYLAYSMWRDDGGLSINGEVAKSSYFKIALRAILINALNPKLTIFFLAFLPQFISQNATSPMLDFAILSTFFIVMTFVIFVVYGFFANALRRYIISSKKTIIYIQKGFAMSFAALAFKLALSEK